MLVQEGEIQRIDGFHGESEIENLPFPLFPKPEIRPRVSFPRSEGFSIDALTAFRESILNETLLKSGQGVAMERRHLDIVDHE